MSFIFNLSLHIDGSIGGNFQYRSKHFPLSLLPFNLGRFFLSVVSPTNEHIQFFQLPPSYHLREGLEDLRSYDFLLSSCLIPLARAISRLVIPSTSNDFKESLTVLQLIVIIG